MLEQARLRMGGVLLIGARNGVWLLRVHLVNKLTFFCRVLFLCTFRAFLPSLDWVVKGEWGAFIHVLERMIQFHKLQAGGPMQQHV